MLKNNITFKTVSLTFISKLTIVTYYKVHTNIKVLCYKTYCHKHTNK